MRWERLTGQGIKKLILCVTETSYHIKGSAYARIAKGVPRPATFETDSFYHIEGPLEKILRNNKHGRRADDS